MPQYYLVNKAINCNNNSTNINIINVKTTASTTNIITVSTKTSTSLTSQQKSKSSTSLTTTTEKSKTTRKDDDTLTTTITTEKSKTTRKDDNLSIWNATTKATTTEATISSSTTSTTTSTTTKTGPPKGYRDGENNITDTTSLEFGTTTQQSAKKTSETSTSRTTATSKTTAIRGEDLKGGFEIRTTTTPKMKTTRIDTSNEFEYDNNASFLTTTSRYESITFPVIAVTQKSDRPSNAITPKATDAGILTTKFSVIQADSNQAKQQPHIMPGITIAAMDEMIEPIIGQTTTTSPSILNVAINKSDKLFTFRPKIMIDVTAEPTYPAITKNITDIPEMPGTTATMPVIMVEPMVPISTTNPPLTIDNNRYITTTQKQIVTVINTTCTVHTNCGPNKLCVMGLCRLKCHGDGRNDYDCVKGIINI